MYERLGVYFPDKPLSRYGLQCGALLEPVAKAIKQELLSKDYLQADETRLKVLEKGRESDCNVDVKDVEHIHTEQIHTEQIHTGQLWVLSNPLEKEKLTYYEYHDSRSKDAASLFLSGFNGVLQTDGYSCYEEHSGVHLECMAHARRYFVKAKDVTPKESNHVLKLIGRLYRIESELKKNRGELKEEQWYKRRLKQRKAHAVPMLEKLKSYLVILKDKYLLEGHPLYKAIHYMLNRFEALSLYTRGKWEYPKGIFMQRSSI